MSRFIRAAWKYGGFILTILFIFASLTTFIAPKTFAFAAVLGLAFPYILAAYILVCLINFFRHTRRAFIMLLLLPLAWFNISNTIALRPEKKWQNNKDSATLRVMTWNVQSFANYLRKKESKAAYRTTRDEMLAVIDQYKPDVLCIQEYRNIENAKRRIAIRKQLDSLGFHYYLCSNDRVGAFPKNPNVIVSEGVAIYSKYPLSDSMRININHSDKNENMIYADILFQQKPLRIYTAHLQSFTIYNDTSNAKFEGDNIYEITYKKRRDAQYKIMDTEKKHQDEVNIIRSSIDESPYPMIYCGDLNITPTSYNYRLLKGSNMQDAFLKKGSGIGNTFYKIGPTLRIDVCLADTALAVAQCKREKRKLSDHYPVITDLKWK